MLHKKVSMRYGTLITNLESVLVLDDILLDYNHAYTKKNTHIHSWISGPILCSVNIIDAYMCSDYAVHFIFSLAMMTRSIVDN